MAKKTVCTEMPEVVAYKKVKSQIEAEEKKLAEAQEALAILRKNAAEYEYKISEAALNKESAMERYVLDKTRLPELNEAKKQCLKITQDHNNAKELAGVTESLIEKQEHLLGQLRPKLRECTQAVWDKIADIYQDKLEQAVGDIASLLWVAVRNGGRFVPTVSPYDLPARFNVIAAPHTTESEPLRARLWNEFVEEG